MKRFVSVFLTATLAFSLIGCSKGSSESEITDVETTEETTVPIIDFSYRGISEGDVVQFGSYEQDDDGDLEPIDWIVVKKQDGKVLLLSSYALEYMPYDDGRTQTNWANSSIREWLNYEFYFDAFTETEMEIIVASDIETNDAPTHYSTWLYSTVDEIDTVDHVFLLGYDDYIDMYGIPVSGVSGDEMLALCGCVGTEHAINTGAAYWDNHWWLREPGEWMTYDYHEDGTVDLAVDAPLFYAAILSEDNSLYSNSYNVNTAFGIRPCVWLDMNDYME